MKSYWNYRVVRKQGNPQDEFYYEIHEVYYKNDKINLWTEKAIVPFGLSVKELQNTLRQMIKDSKAPVLEIIKDKKGKEKLVEIKE